MKILKQFMNPGVDQIRSWIKWIKKYCSHYVCCGGNCRYCNPENNGRVCKIPPHILYMSMNKFPEDVQPQEPPENVLDILNGVDLEEIIDFQ